MTARVAAVDVGTNSVRLIVAEKAAPVHSVERLMTITRLGTGVDANGRLDDGALARTLDCIAGYADRWTELGAERVRITATSAIRDAADRDRFFDGVRDRTGVTAEVLTGEQEAATAFRGATATVSGLAPFLVLDIGGGSTELILGSSEAETMTSRQLGCVRLTERCLRSDPPTGAELEAARIVVGTELEAAAALFDPSVAKTLVGVAGTVTTVAALHLGLARYEPQRIHGARVPLESVRRITGGLAAKPAADRAGGPMAAGREDVIVAGAVILQAVMERFDFAEVLVSEADILDGLAMGLLD